MTHPLTPREKVADDLKLVLAHAMVEELRHQHPGLEQIDSERGDLWLPGGCTPQSSGCVIDIHSVAASVEREVSGLLKEAYRDGWSDREGDFLVGFDRITGNTALASGSGDHAKLIGVLRADRLPECSFDDGRTWELDGVGVAETFSRAADALEALLSENAALRINEKAALKECSEWARKAGEAIGKLETSEAAGIVEGWKDRATEAERKLAEADQVIREISETAQITRVRHLARTFLSKEAERG